MTQPDVDGVQLPESGELNRAIVEAMPCGLVHVRADGSIVTANAEALRILGLSYDQLTRRYTRDFDPETLWEDGSRCPVESYPVTRALQTGQPQPPVTIGVRTQNGATSWAIYTAVPLLGSAGEVTGAVVTFLDVTRQRATELALRQSEARMRSVVESVAGYVLLLDRKLCIQFCNRLLPGVQPEQVFGQSVLLFVRETDQQDLKEKFESILATGVPQAFEVAAAAWLGGGTYRLSAGPLRDAAEITGMTVVAEDISRHKEMEGRLLLSERLASIGILAAGVAHEINNPLTYLMGNLELIERQLEGVDPELKSRIVEAAEGADRIGRVVADLMSFSHRDDVADTPVNVSAVIDRAARMAHHEIQRRARFVRGPCEVPDVAGSAARVGQVLLNLLINAAHAIPLGNAECNEIRVSAQRISDGLVRISVSDTGQGIERALLGRIFDPFITTKPLGEGTGLGLYVCHNIVIALGGAIWADSQVGRGSTFHVDLPLFKEARKAGSPAAPAKSSEPARVHQLLVVDDEPSIVAFVRHALAPHEVATARSGREGIAALEGRTFDAVLCDLVMPDVTGAEVFAYVKARRPELVQRFLFITGGAIGELAPEIAGLGLPVLYKPFSVRDLRDAVNRLLTDA